MRILLTAFSISARTGSELAVLEIAESLRDRGHKIAIATVRKGSLASTFQKNTGIRVFRINEVESILEFQAEVMHVFHWPTLLFLQQKGVDLPWVIGFLGVLPSIENPIPLLEKSPMWYGISEEVRSNILQIRGWEDSIARSRIIRNWFDDRNINQIRKLTTVAIRRVAFVSNHDSEEIQRSLQFARDKLGIKIEHIGAPGKIRKVDAKFLLKYDAIITIGRTAILSMAVGLPTLITDLNGSDGWVLEKNVQKLSQHNFSGRASSHIVTESTIAENLQNPPTLNDLTEVQKWAWENTKLSSAVSSIEKLCMDAMELGENPQFLTRSLGTDIWDVFREISLLNLEFIPRLFRMLKAFYSRKKYLRTST